MLEASNIHIRNDLSVASDQLLNYGLKVFQYHDRWKNLSKEDFTTRPEYNTINYMKGYEYSRDTKGFKKTHSKKGKGDPAVIPRSNQLYIKAINQICKNNGIKFIIVNVPSVKYWSDETHDAIQGFCDKNCIEYLDLNMYSNEISIDWEKETRDKGDHLNHAGALKVTKCIGKYLSEENILESHKDDEKYKDWNEQYKEYECRANNKK